MKIRNLINIFLLFLISAYSFSIHPLSDTQSLSNTLRINGIVDLSRSNDESQQDFSISVGLYSWKTITNLKGGICISRDCSKNNIRRNVSLSLWMLEPSETEYSKIKSIKNHINSLCDSNPKDKPIYFITPHNEAYIKLILEEVNKTSELGCNFFVMVMSGNSYFFKDNSYKYLGSIDPSDISKMLKALEYPIRNDLIRRIAIITYGNNDYNKGIKEEEYITQYFKDYSLEFNEECTVIYGRSICLPYFIDLTKERDIERAKVIKNTLCPLKVIEDTDILIVNVIDTMWAVVISELDSCDKRLNYIMFFSSSKFLFIDNVNHIEYTVDNSILHNRNTINNNKITNEFIYEIYEYVTPYIEYINNNIKLKYISTPDNKFLFRGYDVGILIENHISQFSKSNDQSKVENIFSNGFTGNTFESFIDSYIHITDNGQLLILPGGNTLNTYYTNILIDDRHMNIGDNISLTNREVLLSVKIPITASSYLSSLVAKPLTIIYEYGFTYWYIYYSVYVVFLLIIIRFVIAERKHFMFFYSMFYVIVFIIVIIFSMVYFLMLEIDPSPIICTLRNVFNVIGFHCSILFMFIVQYLVTTLKPPPEVLKNVFLFIFLMIVNVVYIIISNEPYQATYGYSMLDGYNVQYSCFEVQSTTIFIFYEVIIIFICARCYVLLMTDFLSTTMYKYVAVILIYYLVVVVLNVDGIKNEINEVFKVEYIVHYIFFGVLIVLTMIFFIFYKRHFNEVYFSHYNTPEYKLSCIRNPLFFCYFLSKDKKRVTPSLSHHLKVYAQLEEAKIDFNHFKGLLGKAKEHLLISEVTVANVIAATEDEKDEKMLILTKELQEHIINDEFWNNFLSSRDFAVLLTTSQELTGGFYTLKIPIKRIIYERTYSIWTKQKTSYAKQNQSMYNGSTLHRSNSTYDDSGNSETGRASRLSRTNGGSSYYGHSVRQTSFFTSNVNSAAPNGPGPAKKTKQNEGTNLLRVSHSNNTANQNRTSLKPKNVLSSRSYGNNLAV